MEIKYQNKPLDDYAIYDHTRAHSTQLKDVEDGLVITPDEVCVYTDLNNKGEEVTITSIIDSEGIHYTTNSPNFLKEFMFIANLMKDKPYRVVVRKPVSKGGRTFITCELVRERK